jgi:LysM repeat protein
MERTGRASALAVIGGLGLVLAGCGTTDQASQETLPPIRTTVATTTTTTTTIPPGQRFYTVQPGDTLGKIAAEFQVPVEAIVAQNELANADDIQAGQTLEIPSDVVVITELPGQGGTAP